MTIISSCSHAAGYKDASILFADGYRHEANNANDVHPRDAGDAVFGTRDLQIRLADTEAGRNSASMLISKMYSWRGYTGSHMLHESPNRITLTASMKEVLVGTVTLSIDSPAGLLADEIFKDEIDKRRNENSKLCELTKLAFNADAHSP